MRGCLFPYHYRTVKFTAMQVGVSEPGSYRLVEMEQLIGHDRMASISASEFR